MKTNMKTNKFITLAMVGLMVSSLAATSWAKSPKMKMTTPIPPEITTPDTVETRLGTLNFKWGMPDQESIQKVYDNIEFTRAETTMRLNHGSVFLEGPFD